MILRMETTVEKKYNPITKVNAQPIDVHGNPRTVTEFKIVQGHDDAIHFFPGVKV